MTKISPKIAGYLVVHDYSREVIGKGNSAEGAIQNAADTISSSIVEVLQNIEDTDCSLFEISRQLTVVIPKMRIKPDDLKTTKFTF